MPATWHIGYISDDPPNIDKLLGPYVLISLDAFHLKGEGLGPAIDILLKNELTLIEGMPTANKTK